VPVIAVVRGILHPAQAFRVVDPDRGVLVEHTPGTLPWDELVPGIARWVGISQASAASVRAVAPADVQVSTILNGVSVPEWRPPAPVGHHGVRLVAVCRSVAWKRLDVLIDAVAAMRHRDRVHLDVYGEAGSEQPRLEHRIATLNAPVTFHGWAGDLARHLAGAHALVSASDQEGFGRGILDAAGVAVPAIVPDTGANPELVLHGTTGYTYDATDPRQLTERLDDIAEADPATLAALGWAARRRALGRFTPARCADEYLELCHTLLALRRPVGVSG
jgi:glycosyltransferase involved in cell wall biosynthesis